MTFSPAKSGTCRQLLLLIFFIWDGQKFQFNRHWEVASNPKHQILSVAEVHKITFLRVFEESEQIIHFQKNFDRSSSFVTAFDVSVLHSDRNQKTR